MKLHKVGSLIAEIYPNDPNSFEKVDQGLLAIAWYTSKERVSQEREQSGPFPREMDPKHWSTKVEPFCPMER